jgi:hypothetical protein
MRSKRAIQFIPLLIGLGIRTRKGTGIGGTALSVAYYNQLSVDLTNDVEQVARSIMTTQDQLNSLASVVLQNESGLDLLTAKKKGFDFSQTQGVVLCKADRNRQRYS